MPTDLSATALDQAIGGRLGRPFRYLEEIGSTNAEALEWADRGAPEGALVVTDHQTAGRGRWGRQWSSAPGALLQMSLVLRPNVPTRDAGLVTTCIGVACARALDTWGLDARLKWPNDVLVGDRKISGILVESRIENELIATAVAGIGMNVNWRREDMPSEIADRATSILIETGAEADRSVLLARFISELEPLYGGLLRGGKGRDGILSEASERSVILGRDVVVRLSNGSSVEGGAVRLLPTGALELRAGGRLWAVEVGEVEQIRPA